MYSEYEDVADILEQLDYPTPSNNEEYNNQQLQDKIDYFEDPENIR